MDEQVNYSEVATGSSCVTDEISPSPSGDVSHLPSPKCEGCLGLENRVSELEKKLEELTTKLEKTERQLKKAEFERDSSSKYVDSFREQVSQLHKKLDAEKKRNTALEEKLNQNQNVHNEGKGDWATGKSGDDISTDIASSIREAAKDIATSIREAAQQATTSNGFIYDETTGLYYDYNTGYYYDPNTRLYYDCRKGIYYTYDYETGSYDFYSQVAVSYQEPVVNDKDVEGTQEDKGDDVGSKGENNADTPGVEVVESGSEDGEIIEVNENDQDGADEKEEEESEKEEEFPPCIRAIVMKSDKIPVGSLNIVTCMGITFGRMEATGNCLRLSDVEVSKEHAKIHYDNDSSQYYVTDLGSQNGTFVNGTRLSESKVISEPRLLRHGEQLRLGGTTFLLHIHSGNETCDECEPGQVQAQMKAKELEDEVQITRVVTTVNDTDTNTLRKKELNRIKKRYMLQNSDHEVNAEIASSTGRKYKDRAHFRRKKVGSDVPVSKMNDTPSSVYKPIKTENKGRRMLEKMGWSAGEGLGKTKSGRTEPVFATVRESGRGLGYAGLKSFDIIPQNSKSIIWRKAQERYNAQDLGSFDNSTAHKSPEKGKSEPIVWRKAQERYNEPDTSNFDMSTACKNPEKEKSEPVAWRKPQERYNAPDLGSAEKSATHKAPEIGQIEPIVWRKGRERFTAPDPSNSVKTTARKTPEKGKSDPIDMFDDSDT